MSVSTGAVRLWLFCCVLPVVQMCYQCVFCLISVWCQFTGKPVSLLFNYGGPDVPLEPLSTNKITARPPKHPKKKMCKFIGPNMFCLRPIYSGFCSVTVSLGAAHVSIHIVSCTSTSVVYICCCQTCQTFIERFGLFTVEKCLRLCSFLKHPMIASYDSPHVCAPACIQYFHRNVCSYKAYCFSF